MEPDLTYRRCSSHHIPAHSDHFRRLKLYLYVGCTGQPNHIHVPDYDINFGMFGASCSSGDSVRSASLLVLAYHKDSYSSITMQPATSSRFVVADEGTGFLISLCAPRDFKLRFDHDSALFVVLAGLPIA